MLYENIIKYEIQINEIMKSIKNIDKEILKTMRFSSQHGLILKKNIDEMMKQKKDLEEMEKFPLINLEEKSRMSKRINILYETINELQIEEQIMIKGNYALHDTKKTLLEKLVSFTYAYLMLLEETLKTYENISVEEKTSYSVNIKDKVLVNNTSIILSVINEIKGKIKYYSKIYFDIMGFDYKEIPSSHNKAKEKSA